MGWAACLAAGGIDPVALAVHCSKKSREQEEEALKADILSETARQVEYQPTHLHVEKEVPV